MTQPEESEAEVPEHFQVAVTKTVELLLGRFSLNILRIQGLTELYSVLKKVGDVTEEIRTDVLRATVVFMHASLEELLRQLAASFLPVADEEALNSIPLAGSPAGSRPEKFFLGRLAKHRGKSVDELLLESVQEHLSTSNFNDVGEIDRLLVATKLEAPAIRAHYPAIAAMMKRRHSIVHRADVAADTVDGRAQELAATDVVEWHEALLDFARDVLGKAVVRHLVSSGALNVLPDRTISIPDPT